ncbi:hypothetical protein QBC37DRAFT_456514 [Rhypophila decipiens]|uniref:Uncharacterized protein n=1 Tax=Rhypophila decipiens TaxID=261697 RepID=A0AAN7B172_9PEZI|nr:hypothetical protein QBC37DRAFT_456514 [Rhypophila decipiens]
MLAKPFALVGLLATSLSAAALGPRAGDEVLPASEIGDFEGFTFLGEVPNPHAYITTNVSDTTALDSRGIISKRDSCFWWWNSLATFRTFIARDFANALQSASNAHTWYALNRGTCLKWQTGTEVRICACNDYVFENTHFKPWEAGWGTKNRLDACCGGAFDCRGGDITGHGDSGLQIRITTWSPLGLGNGC